MPSSGAAWRYLAPRSRGGITPAAARARFTGKPSRRQPNPWHQATAATERIPRRLNQDDDEASQAHLAAFGEALDALPLLAPQPLRPQLRKAATAFERATRSRIQAEHHHARALRGAVRAMLRQPAPKDGAALAMFLDAAILVVIAAARWHQLRQHDQQVAAAHQTLLHLQAAYEQAAAASLAAIAQRRPPQQTVAGTSQRLSERPAPSAQARAAEARSAAWADSAARRPNTPVHQAAAAPTPQPPQARRR